MLGRACTGVNELNRPILLIGQGDNMDKKKIAALVVAVLAILAGLVATWGGEDKAEAEKTVEEAAKPAETPAVVAPVEVAPPAETVVVPATEATPAPAVPAAK